MFPTFFDNKSQVEPEPPGSASLGDPPLLTPSAGDGGADPKSESTSLSWSCPLMKAWTMVVK